MKYWLVIILGLNVNLTAIANPTGQLLANFKKFQGSVKPRKGYVDLNENFLNPTTLVSDNVIWPQPLQYLQDEIELSVALPQTLLRSFILVIEKRFGARQIDHSITLERYPQRSTAHLFINESVGVAAYHIRGAYSRAFSTERTVNDGLYGERALSELQKASRFYRGSIQVLIGDVGGSGVTSLVSQYAKSSGRQIVSLGPMGMNADSISLARDIQNNVRQGNAPILFFDDFGRNSIEVIEAISVLIENRALIGNASLIISLGGQQMASEFGSLPPVISSLESAFTPKTKDDPREIALRSIVANSDAVHIVRNPQSWQYYADIIRINLPSALNQIARRLGIENNLSLSNEASIIEQLAKASWDKQVATRQSTVRELLRALRSGYSSTFHQSYMCDEILGPVAIRASIHFYQAVKNYDRALKVQ